MTTTIGAKNYIKIVSTVPSSFIDEMFEMYDTSTLQTHFIIKLDVVAKWLKCGKYKLALTLRKSYIEGKDYVIRKNLDIPDKKDARHNNYKTYFITPDCFKRLAMMSRSKNGEMIRTYFIEIENLFIKYREQTIDGILKELQTLQHNQKPKGNFEAREGYLYIIRASETKDGLYKIGRSSKDLIKRLKNYNNGRADDIEVLYTYQAPNVVGAEGCLKAYLKKYQYRKYKEVYQADITMIKEFIQSCSNIGAKLVQKKRSTTLSGGYYIVLST